MQAQRHEPQNDDAQYDPSEGLTEQVEECASEALDLGGVVVDAGLDKKPTDHQEDDIGRRALPRPACTQLSGGPPPGRGRPGSRTLQRRKSGRQNRPREFCEPTGPPRLIGEPEVLQTRHRRKAWSLQALSGDRPRTQVCPLLSAPIHGTDQMSVLDKRTNHKVPGGCFFGRSCSLIGTLTSKCQ